MTLTVTAIKSNGNPDEYVLSKDGIVYGVLTGMVRPGNEAHTIAVGEDITVGDPQFGALHFKDHLKGVTYQLNSIYQYHPAAVSNDPNEPDSLTPLTHDEICNALIDGLELSTDAGIGLLGIISQGLLLADQSGSISVGETVVIERKNSTVHA